MFLIAEENTKLINITILIDIYHAKCLYLSTMHIVYSMYSVNKITPSFRNLPSEFNY